MTNKLKASAAVIGTMALVLGTGPLLADMGDVRALEKAKITLIDAIKAAESNNGGRAYDASIDDDSFTPQFEVSVVRDGKTYDVQVDAVTGKVTNVREDLDD